MSFRVPVESTVVYRFLCFGNHSISDFFSKYSRNFAGTMPQHLVPFIFWIDVCGNQLPLGEFKD